MSAAGGLVMVPVQVFPTPAAGPEGYHQVCSKHHLVCDVIKHSWTYVYGVLLQYILSSPFLKKVNVVYEEWILRYDTTHIIAYSLVDDYDVVLLWLTPGGLACQALWYVSMVLDSYIQCP